jgi:hypothetical protein
MPSSLPIYNEIFFYDWPSQRSSIMFGNEPYTKNAFIDIEQSFYDAGVKNKEITDTDKIVASINGVGISSSIFERELNIQRAMDAYSYYAIKQSPIIDSSKLESMLTEYRKKVEEISPEERVLNRLIETEVLSQYLENSKFTNNNDANTISSSDNIAFAHDNDANNNQFSETEKIIEAYAKGLGYTLTEYVDFLGNKTQDYSHEIAIWKSGMLKDMDRDELDLFIKNLIYLADIVVID